MVCQDNESDKTERADGILEYINEEIHGKKVLDFGCGEGHVVLQANKLGANAWGYDESKTGMHLWDDGDSRLTTSFDKIKSHAPFDLVILYDVLDHTVNPVETLKQVHSICHGKTRVWVRCHSWMSRHAGHYYQKLNKAWIHLVFTDEELKLLHLEPKVCQKYFFPINTHKSWFANSAFVALTSDISKNDVEPFFSKPEIMRRLPIDKFEHKLPEWQMSQSFNDYLLQIK